MIIGANFELEVFGRFIRGKLSAEKFERELVRLVNAGAGYIELNGDLIKVFEKGFSRNKGIIHAACDKRGISLGLHLPTFGVALESYWKHSREAIIRDMKELIIEQYAPIKFENFVFHMPDIEKFLAHDMQRSLANNKRKIRKFLLKSLEKMPRLKDLVNFNYLVIGRVLPEMIRSLKELRAFSDIEKVCFENSELIKHEYYCSIFDRLAKESDLSICLDIGHLKTREIIENKDFLLPFLKKYQNKIREVHIHDVKILPSGKISDHLPLGSGILDLKNTLKLLKDFDFQGPIVVETHYYDPVISLKVLTKALKNI